MKDGEMVSLVLPSMMNAPKVKELARVLKDWVNDVLAPDRIIVKDLRDDLYDGQVLQKLFERLNHASLNLSDIRQAELEQKKKLKTVLERIDEYLELGVAGGTTKWSVDSIHSKNYVAILHLLVALAIKSHADIRLPEFVSITVHILTRKDGRVEEEVWEEKVTHSQAEMTDRKERDAFDTLEEKEPEKYQKLQNSLIVFVNKNLQKLNLEATDMQSSFADGCYLIMLIGQLDGYFVPHYSYHIPADSDEKKLKNVEIALELIGEAGCKLPPKVRAHDIVHHDVKSTLRVIYCMYEKFIKA